nr:sucrose synthase [Ipomoea batatas]GMD35386.1 sucrose synthase [Ipomoea batatas]GMD37094.1 sucrose synthase [Ipomoea batatas]GMD38650.1 sucrose synthase [Ipomoea batatas]GME19352.1 sucrose synthase [Ipomoea batatas]
MADRVLTRVHSLRERLDATLAAHRNEILLFMSRIESHGKGGLKRIQEKYTWQIYSDRLLTLAAVYGFWKHVSKLDRLEIRRYLEMFYALKYRKLAEAVPLAEE